MDHVDRGYEGLETALAALGETFAGRPARKAEQETPASADAGKGYGAAALGPGRRFGLLRGTGYGKEKKRTQISQTAGRHRHTILAVLLIAASVVAACTVFFRVEEVTVEGNERYSQEQILSVASVEMGANMILTPGGEQIAQRIYRALPYVDHVEVQKRFPTTLKMVITESQPVAVITGAASAWIVDAKGKLLEQADETQAQEYTKVTGLELLEPEQGAQAQTTPENQAQLTA